MTAAHVEAAHVDAGFNWQGSLASCPAESASSAQRCAHVCAPCTTHQEAGAAKGARQVGVHFEQAAQAAGGGDDDVGPPRQLLGLRPHVQPAHHHAVLERHAGTQRTELVGQLEGQLPAGARGVGRKGGWPETGWAAAAAEAQCNWRRARVQQEAVSAAPAWWA